MQQPLKALTKPILTSTCEIKIGTPAQEFVSAIQWKDDIEAKIETENARLREIEEERLASEAQEAERAYQAELRAIEQEKNDEEAAMKAAADAAAAEANEAEEAKLLAEIAEKEAADRANAEADAKIKADKEAYDDMMMLDD